MHRCWKWGCLCITASWSGAACLQHFTKNKPKASETSRPTIDLRAMQGGRQVRLYFNQIIWKTVGARIFSAAAIRELESKGRSRDICAT